MQVKRTADYALRIVLSLASESGQKTSILASELHVPKAYVSKVIQGLVRKGILFSRRGAGGGITLARTPDRITLKEVIDASQGGIPFGPCLISHEDCPLVSTCPISRLWREMQSLIVDKLGSVTISELVATREALVQSQNK